MIMRLRRDWACWAESLRVQRAQAVMALVNEIVLGMIRLSVEVVVVVDSVLLF